jgi:nucleolin
MPKLFFGNLPHSLSDSELQSWVESRGFSVESTEIIYDQLTGKSRGFGFVTLSEGLSIQSAASLLNGRRMNGRVLRVNEARSLGATLAYAGDRSPTSATPPFDDHKH